jgi:hypothetical protein
MKPSAELIIKTPAQKLHEALDRECPEDRLAAVISEGLTATVRNRDGTVSPDYRSRLASAQLALFFKHGKPVERQEIHQTVTNRSEEENMKTLASPAMLAAMKNLIAKAEAKE